MIISSEPQQLWSGVMKRKGRGARFESGTETIAPGVACPKRVLREGTR
jgi:hypothetical protein